MGLGLPRRLLAELKKGMTPEAILARMDEGLPKLWLIHQGLQLRRSLPAVFGAEGDYEPLLTSGSRADHAVAFTRGGDVAVVVPRLPLRLGGDWRGTTVALPPGSWRDELTGEEVEGGERPVSELLARFPVALLARSRM
jgi:(1->4)-alpha-D-glucan 1-alpha-D-glucosylmutase